MLCHYKYMHIVGIKNVQHVSGLYICITGHGRFKYMHIVDIQAIDVHPIPPRGWQTKLDLAIKE